MAAFKARAEKLIAYYDTITAFRGRRFTVKMFRRGHYDMAGMKSILTLAEDTEGLIMMPCSDSMQQSGESFPTMRGSMIA